MEGRVQPSSVHNIYLETTLAFAFALLVCFVVCNNRYLESYLAASGTVVDAITPPPSSQLICISKTDHAADDVANRQTNFANLPIVMTFEGSCSKFRQNLRDPNDPFHERTMTPSHYFS
mmetsp:Transcript_3330/g.9480  ORF Transcript_3330/g.9480 Transcript_3330/m.9480 type:complete len:119 (+) Transcript_3330:97-453(+)